VTGVDLAAGRPIPFALDLRVLDVPLRVETNSPDVWRRLSAYYAPHVADGPGTPTATIRLLQGPADAAGAFADVLRADGKRVKEAVRDVPGGRLVRKRQTRVLMGIYRDHAVAAGDLEANLNQAINLVNACYARAVLARGALLLHASGVVWAGRVAAICGVAGAGKSTAALHLVEAGYRFLSNDRVLARVAPAAVEARGYPKQPRVNPGTLLHHPRLASLLEPEDRDALASLPPEELWALERKMDVDLDAIYGPGTVELAGELRLLVVLTWHLGGPPAAARRLEPVEALARVPILHKDLGVFDLDRPAHAERAVGQLTRYAELLERIAVVEVTGRPDFRLVVDLIGDLL
jgi:HprK-related kinase B